MFNQSGMVVLLMLGVIAIWYVSDSHLEEFKLVRKEEKIEQRDERDKFLKALEACCKSRERDIANGFSSN